MNSTYLVKVSKEEWDAAVASEDYLYLHDAMTQPLHEELYKRGSFDFMDELSDGQQMMLAYDYIQSQVAQGGFIQFIQNHYVSLLVPAIEGLKKTENVEMVSILDDVLKVYVLNREALDKETSVNEFAALYNEFREFEPLEDRFKVEDENTITDMVKYALGNPGEFIEPL